MTLTSATGDSGVTFARSRGSAAAVRSERGFTLIELMVVLVVIGLASAMVVLVMPDPRGDIRADGERFAARAKAAQNLAILQARPVAILVSERGYSFQGRAEGEWRPLKERSFEPAQWSDDTTALLGAGGARRVLFDTTGTNEPFQLTLERGSARISVSISTTGHIRVGA